MLKNRKMLVIAGVIVAAIGLDGCGNKSVSTTPEISTVVSTSEEDLDALVEKKVQEQLEIDRRVKEGIEAAKAKETEAITMAPTTAATNTGTYILPFSDSRLVTNDDLAKLSKDQLRLARNEIFARHGRIFKSDDLNQYFRSQSWYNPSVPSDQFKESVLSKVESDNVARISNYEKNGTADSKPMQLKSGEYVFTDTPNMGDGTFTITVNPSADWPIYFEYLYSDIYHPATEFFGYMTDMGNGTYRVIRSTGTDDWSVANETEYMTIKMISNGFKDVVTGEVYVYQKN